MRIPVLDKGYIELIDHLGSDLTVVNAARVSFGKEKKELDEKDKVLMQYLADNDHFSPFRHNILQFRISAPEFVLRQLYKHVVGIETTASYPTKDHAWSELSLRYRPIRDYHTPTEWRMQSEDNKQASEGLVENQAECQEIFAKTMDVIFHSYEKLLSLGVAKEQARIILPLNIYTNIFWTASFQAIANFIELRDHAHAQVEIREYAKAIIEITKSIYPEICKVWFNKKV